MTLKGHFLLRSRCKNKTAVSQNFTK